MVFVIIVLLAPFLGGIYGIVHDQITYTISNEYYTKFKFIQFGLSEWGGGINIGTAKQPEIQLINPRLGVAIVGFMATWWVGLFIGIILGLVGFIYSDGKKMLRMTLWAILLTICVALITGFLGLFYGKCILVNDPPNWFFPSNLIDQKNFIMVGAMHNFSYLGGMFGLLVSVIFMMRSNSN